MRQAGGLPYEKACSGGFSPVAAMERSQQDKRSASDAKVPPQGVALVYSTSEMNGVYGAMARMVTERLTRSMRG